MGKIFLMIATAALGLWMIYSATQIRSGGKPENGSLGQRIRYEDMNEADKPYFLALTRRYHFMIGGGFIALALAGWLISKPVIVLFLYLAYAAAINLAKAKIEAHLLAGNLGLEDDPS